MKLYHGTNSDVAMKALQTGLEPRSVTKASNWKHTIVSNRHCIYLTDAYPVFFAVQAAKKSKPAVIEIDTDLLDEFNFVPDEDVLEQYFKRVGDDLPTDWDMKRRTRFYRERLKDYQGTDVWETSLKAMGTCAHFGAIPANAITRIATIDKNKQAGLLFEASDAMMVIANYQFCGAKYKNLTNWVFGETPVDDAQDEIFKKLGMSTQRERFEKAGRDGIEIISVS